MNKIYKILLIIMFSFTLKIASISAAPDEYVAAINGAQYKSLSAAINDASTSGKTTITLLKDLQANVTIPNGYNIELDLQGYTLSNNKNDASVITNNGILEVKNGTIMSDAKAGVINNNSTAVLTVSSGTIKAVGSRQALYNDGGTLYVTGNAYIESVSGERAAIHNKTNGKAYITGGTVVSKSLYAIYNEKGTLNIGTKDDVYNKTAPVIQGKTYGIVTNNNYKYNVYDGIIKGGTYHAGKTSNSGNTPTVSSDIDETKIEEIEVDSEKVLSEEVIDGTNYKTFTFNLDNSNKIKITFDPNGGEVSPNYKRIVIGDTIGTLPVPSRLDYSFDGWFTAATDGTQIDESSTPDSDITYFAHWTYVDPATVAYVEGVGYTTLKNAFLLGGNIRLESDVIITEPLEMNKMANLDLNGHTINLQDNTITITEKVTINDSTTGQNGKITSTADFGVIVGLPNAQSNGYLIHKGGTIEGLGAYGAIRNYETTEIDGGVVLGTATTNRGYTIYNQKNLIIKSGYVYSSNGSAVQVHTNSTFTMDGGLVKTDAIHDQAVNLYGDCSATINGGTIEALNNDGAGIAMFHNTNLTVNGGTIKGYGMAVSGNGNENSSNANITINGGDLIATNGVAMYLPQRDSTTIINGGNISGPTGIEIRASKLIVNGGNITGTNDTYEVVPNASGTTTKGAAIAVSQHTTRLPIEVYINGGNLKSVVPLAETNPMNNPQSSIDLVSINVTQGNFESTGDTTISMQDNIQVNSFITGGTYSTDPIGHVADGYGVVKNENNMFEVTKLHSISFNQGLLNVVSTENDKYPHKSEVELSVKGISGYKISINVTDSNGNKLSLRNNRFIMPDSDVIVNVTYKEIANPKTADTVMSNVIMLFISSIGLSFVYIKRKLKKA